SPKATPVGDRPEDLRREQTVALRLERAVVDGLRLGDLAERPLLDLLRRREADADRVEVRSKGSLAIGKRGSHQLSPPVPVPRPPSLQTASAAAADVSSRST